jgi:hypothetical protein
LLAGNVQLVLHAQARLLDRWPSFFENDRFHPCRPARHWFIIDGLVFA